jgi:hypothetical protein
MGTEIRAMKLLVSWQCVVVGALSSAVLRRGWSGLYGV